LKRRRRKITCPFFLLKEETEASILDYFFFLTVPLLDDVLLDLVAEPDLDTVDLVLPVLVILPVLFIVPTFL
jgi:hypothetical protein